MTKFRILLCVVVLFAASEASLAQRLGQRLASRHEQRWHTRYHSGADSGSAAIAGWQDDNMSHAVDSGVNLAIDAVSEKLGRLKTGYDVVQGSDEFVNRGLLGNPHKPMQIIAGALSGPLGAAGVGPQADFIVRFAETKANLDMALHDEASAVLNAGIAQQNLDRYGITGDAGSRPSRHGCPAGSHAAPVDVGGDEQTAYRPAAARDAGAAPGDGSRRSCQELAHHSSEGALYVEGHQPRGEGE